jgi:hypothetical protein
MLRKFDPKTDRHILDTVCRSTSLPSLAQIHAAFLLHGIEWPVLSPMMGRPTKYAEVVDEEIVEAWKRRGWVR